MQFVERNDLSVTTDDLWQFMVKHVLVKGVEAHQVPADPTHDVGILNLLTTAWKQLTPEEVRTMSSCKAVPLHHVFARV